MSTPATPLSLHLHRQGAGQPVICLHSSSGSHAQWRALAELLGGQRQMFLPDLHGHGRSPAWPEDAADSLTVDANAAWACLEGGGGPIDLVGHSYGGAVALQMALQQPQRVRSLTLYEPVVFGLLRQLDAEGQAWAEIREVAAAVAGRPKARAGELFTNYWSGGPGWERLNAAQQSTVADRMATVSRHFNALFTAAWGPRELQCLQMPVLLISGVLTRLPARRALELLARHLPDARQHWLTKAGHLGPITQAPVVAELIARFLQSETAALPG